MDDLDQTVAEMMLRDDPSLGSIANAAGVKTSSPSLIELGDTGLAKWGNYVTEEFISNLRMPRATKVYKEMSSNDPVVTAIMLTTRQLIQKVTWEVRAGKGAKADFLKEFIESCMDDMSSSWASIIEDITSYFEYGWSYHELVYKLRKGDQKDPSKRSKFYDGLIGWRKIPGRSQESWGGWVFNDQDDGSVSGMIQGTSSSEVVIPIQKALLFRTTSSRGNPEGKSFLRGAYRPWFFKKNIEEFEAIGVERDLAGLPVIQAPEGVDLWSTMDTFSITARQRAEAIVRSIRRDKNEGIALPFGWDLKLLSASGNRQFDTNAIINRYDQRIAITMLADIVMLGADKVGSFALANVKKGLLAAALDAQVKSIAETFNRYAIPRLLSLNGFIDSTAYPKIHPTPVDAPDLKDLADYINKLSGSGMPLFPDVDLENSLRSLANLTAVPTDAAVRKETLERSKQKAATDSNKGDNPNADKKKEKQEKQGGEKEDA